MSSVLLLVILTLASLPWILEAGKDDTLMELPSTYR
jgi:hypothetical protein